MGGEAIPIRTKVQTMARPYHVLKKRNTEEPNGVLPYAIARSLVCRDRFGGVIGIRSSSVNRRARRELA
jgi:hypothetical protein